VLRPVAFGFVCFLTGVVSIGCGGKTPPNPQAENVIYAAPEAAKLAEDARTKLLDILKASGVSPSEKLPGDVLPGAADPGDALNRAVAWVGRFSGIRSDIGRGSTAACFAETAGHECFIFVTVNPQERKLLPELEPGAWLVFTGILTVVRPGEEGSYEFEIGNATIAAIVPPGPDPKRTDRWEAAKKAAEWMKGR